MDREIMIALIVCRNRHHRAGTIFDQHEVGDPDREFVFSDGVNGILLGKDAAFVLSC